MQTVLDRAGITEDPRELHDLASLMALSPAAQMAVAVNEQGELPINSDDVLSSAHAVLLGRNDLDTFVARILLDTNTPQMLAAVKANLASPTVRRAAALSHIRQYRELAAE